ncbi:MAG: succinyldiaminopimelate transaminase, partial [Pseudomonadales bacterium]|nr:succinyldiaminopimelate transaminase [Pseudomonadales bacterium]
MNPLIDQLNPYPFEKLKALKEGVEPVDKPHIAWSIGEPKHTPPSFVLDELTAQLGQISAYPPITGIPALRQAISSWNTKRYSLPENGLNPETQILPVTGTREGLFSFVQAVVDRDQTEPLVLMPNPFYQIYEGATLLAGAKPWFYPCDASNGFLPDLNAIPADILKRCQLMFICTPGNPSGAVMPLEQLQETIKLADKYDFVIASDECYSELYFDESNPPPGLLEACSKLGRHDFSRCIAFNSLSKRSNLAGLRSGFAAGDADIIKQFRLYRTYHGCSIPVPLQKASVKAWNDEQHVIEN